MYFLALSQLGRKVLIFLNPSHKNKKMAVILKAYRYFKFIFNLQKKPPNSSVYLKIKNKKYWRRFGLVPVPGTGTTVLFIPGIIIPVIPGTDNG